MISKPFGEREQKRIEELEWQQKRDLREFKKGFMSSIIKPEHFRPQEKFNLATNKAKELGYSSIDDYIKTNKFTSKYKSGCEMARELGLTDMEMFHKINIVKDYLGAELNKKGINKKFRKGNVHWFFKCGCEYKGLRYRIFNKRICEKHHESLDYEIRICQDCFEEFQVNTFQGAKQYCPDCLDERKRQYKHAKRKR